jgi:hypothetical protein
MTYRLGTFVTALALSAAGSTAMVTAQEGLAPHAGEASETKPGGGLGQGIQVHGRWVIDIRDSDGALVSHHVFENALITVGVQVGGNSVLAGLLGRRFPTVGDWHVILGGANAPCGSEAFRRSCDVTEPTFPATGFPHIFKTLEITVPTRTENFPAIGAREVPVGTMELRGYARATVSGAIAGVSTSLGLCNPGANCFMGGSFSAHTLPTPIAVSEGQHIDVRVVFSFS